MSVPFSNTHLRVPRGFGNILEGLAREVLREQPKDIPSFAAEYFNALLKKRAESGLDPAEWGAKLEDRFYNNHAFKDPEKQGTSGSPEEEKTLKEANAELAGSRENNETEIIQPAQSSTFSNETLVSSEDSKGTELLRSDELDNKANKYSGKTETEPALEYSYKGISDVDICAEELKETKGNKEQTSEAMVVNRDDEVYENAEIDICKTELEPTPLTSYGNLANVDVCAEGFKDTVEEKELSFENSEDSRDLIDASLPAASEPQEKMEVHDGLTLSRAESPAHNEQDIEKDINDMVDEKKTMKSVASPTNAEESLKIDDPTADSQYSISETAKDLVEDVVPEEETTEHANLNEAAENVNILGLEIAHNKDSGSDSEHRTEKDMSVKEDEAQALSDMEETIIDAQSGCEPAEGNILSELDDRSQTGQEETPDDDEGSKDETKGMEHPNSSGTDMQINKNADDKHSDSTVMEKDLVNTNETTSVTDTKETDKSHDCHSDTEVKADTGNENIFSTDLPDTSEISNNPEDKVAPASDDDDDGSDVTDDDNDKDDTEKHVEKVNSPQLFTPDTLNDEEEIVRGNEPSNNDEKDASDTNQKEIFESTEVQMPADTLHDGMYSTNKSMDGPVPDESKEETETAEERLLEEGQDQPETIETNTDQEKQQLSDQNNDQDNADDNATKETEDPESNSNSQEECSQPQEEEDIMDIPLDDPEANKAAAKIQAGFRGHMTRKKMKDDKPSEEVSSSGEALNGSQGDTGRSEAVDSDDTSVPEQ